VLAIAGQTFTGEDDDIQETHDWLDDYERKTGVSIPMHIDGASGGFVNPFLYPDYKWDWLALEITLTSWRVPIGVNRCAIFAGKPVSGDQAKNALSRQAS